MRAQSSFRSVQWMLIVFFALVPTPVLAQQDAEGRAQNPARADQPETEAERGAEALEPQPEQIQEEADGSGIAEQAGDQDPAEEGPRTISGMSILGNQEAPTSLVIVPWRSSQLGDSVGVSTMLDDARQPVDREVFMRALRYYEIRSESRP